MTMDLPAAFGPYQILRRLGKSMNNVYLALDTRENRQAALKLIKSGTDTVSRLVLEAERRGAVIQQRLRALDTRVIEIYDYGDLDGYFFVAMQYVEGRNLAEVLAHDGRMSADRAARIALEICRQLEKFHAFQPGDGATTSVVHGDIKPSNIHLGVNETVRLLDFGIAKTLRPDRAFTFHNFGSPGYCSPERLGRSLVDQQADLWGVGATLYEMLAGLPPYQAEDTRKLERLIQSGRPPRALHANCPAGLRAIVRKALSPAVDRRYPTAEAFSQDLQAFLDRQETVAERERRTAWKPNPTRESSRVAAKLKLAWRLRPSHQTLQLAKRIGTGAACLLTGMLLFIGTSYCSRYWSASRRLAAHLHAAHPTTADLDGGWSLYHGLEAEFAFLGRYSPASRWLDPLRLAYTQAGSAVLDSYVRSSDPAVRHFDWRGAETDFRRAVELLPGNRGTAARLALARGYVTLLRIIESNSSDPAQLAPLRQDARDRFAEAAQHAPDWPDPHLGLARIYLYSLPDYNRALAELDTASRLGFHLGPREIEQSADAHRLRGFEEIQKGNPDAARADFDSARQLYHSIPGFSAADSRLRWLPDLKGAPPAPRSLPSANARWARHKPRPRPWR
jgi:serine/threonine protein kinase